jgi:VanZ family protein
LGFFFGWIVLIMAVLDEIVQIFLRGRVFDIRDIVCNLLSTGFGIWVSRFIKVSWRKK